MNKPYKSFCILAAMTLFITACSIQTVQAQPEEQNTSKAVTYKAVLGESLTDKNVLNFIVNNNCSSANQFQLCQDVGMALWADSDQIVKMVYLYSGNTDGFKRYRGELPFGLTFYDPMWRVEEKLRNQNADDSLEQTGLPDEASSPDHMHYWTVYKRLGMTVIYNSSAADEDAYIYAILIST
jgi:hypothetical protein